MFRTADALGMEKIYLCGITPLPIDELGRPRQAFVKVSLGAERSVPWERSQSSQGVLKDLHARGYTIFALEQDAHSLPYYKVKLSSSELGRSVLVVGSEVKGLPALLLRQADMILEIPMVGKKESLNAAVAFGIVGFALRYQRDYE